jgi:hypothetical protein
MESIKLTFGTDEGFILSVSTVQNNYEKKNLLKIVMEEYDSDSYLINVFGAKDLKSVFPVFKVKDTSFFRFQLNGKTSGVLKTGSKGEISSFPVGDKVYGIEILNEDYQKLFESKGGHSNKILTVWYAPEEEDHGLFFKCRRTVTDGGEIEVDGLFSTATTATIALNNTSTEKFKRAYFKEPSFMHRRNFYFVFNKEEELMGNLYLN